MKHRLACCLLLSISLGGISLPLAVPAQESKPPPKPTESSPPQPEKQRETRESARDPTVDPEKEMLDRAAIEMRQSDFRRAVTASEQILKQVSQLQEKMASGRSRRQSEDLLTEIEKLAKRIKSLSGAGSLEQEERLPESPQQALEQLKVSAEALHQAMKKLNAYAISVEVIIRSDQIIRLSRALRQMIRGESGS